MKPILKPERVDYDEGGPCKERPKPPNAYKDRFGDVFVQKYMLDQYPAAIAAMMRNLVIVRAEMNYCMDAMQYTAMSPAFEDLGRGGLAPIYCPTVYVTTLADGTKDYLTKWTRIPHNDFVIKRIVTTEHFINAHWGIDLAKGPEIVHTDWPVEGMPHPRVEIMLTGRVEHGGGGGDATKIKVQTEKYGHDTWEAIKKKHVK